MEKLNFKIGQKITFRSFTRDGNFKAQRIINGNFRGLPTVRFNGWSNFVIKEREIIKMEN